MIKFNDFVYRHGEHGAQSLIEMIERLHGIHSYAQEPVALEDRWNAVMCAPVPEQRAAA